MTLKIILAASLAVNVILAVMAYSYWEAIRALTKILADNGTPLTSAQFMKYFDITFLPTLKKWFGVKSSPKN